jgi:hypothetical protein
MFDLRPIISRTSHFLTRYEKWFFGFFVLFNLLPVLTHTHFVTLDGPAHLYNSNLINSLLFDVDRTLHGYFTFNEKLLPNWSGHFLLSLCNYFFSSIAAEKIVVLFYLVALPYSFRVLVKTLAPVNVLTSYFIFPFSYSMAFLMGFYNFSIALIFLFFTFSYWIKIKDQKINLGKIFCLFFLFLATYFSHAILFGILLFFIGISILFDFVNAFFQAPKNPKKTILKVFQKAGVILMSSSLALVLFVSYFLSIPATTGTTYLPFSELMENIHHIRSIIAFDSEYEGKYAAKLFYLLIILLLVGFYQKMKMIKNQKKNPVDYKPLFGWPGYWVVITLSILGLYFAFPDSDSYAGFVSVRLELLFFLSLLLLISTLNFPKGILFVGITLASLYNIKLNKRYSQVFSQSTSVAADCYRAAKLIKKNSIVLTLNYSNVWFYGHLANYLGADKPLIILDNYECTNHYFPLRWNYTALPSIQLAGTKHDHYFCSEWVSNESHPTQQIDYVFVLGNLDTRTDTCATNLLATITENYYRISKTENYTLFRYKNHLSN